jgi:hypothetical protein
MRTTLVIDDDVLSAAKEMAASERSRSSIRRTFNMAAYTNGRGERQRGPGQPAHSQRMVSCVS